MTSILLQFAISNLLLSVPLALIAYTGEGLRREVAAGEITQKEMETKFKAAEREMWGHYREVEMKHHRSERKHAEDQDLKKLKAGIEQRLRQFGEDLRKRFAAEEISQKEMEAKFKAAERETWGHYREAEVKHHREAEKRDDRKTPREAYMHRIREIEEALWRSQEPRHHADRHSPIIAEFRIWRLSVTDVK